MVRILTSSYNCLPQADGSMLLLRLYLDVANAKLVIWLRFESLCRITFHDTGAMYASLLTADRSSLYPNVTYRYTSLVHSVHGDALGTG